MHASPANLGVDYAFPKLHAIWSRALTGAALDHLAGAGSLDVVGRVLASLGIDPGPTATVQRQILARHIAELDALRRLMDPATARFYTAFLDRHFLENVKAVLRYRLFPDRDLELGALLLESPALPPLDVEALLGARDAGQFLERFPEHPCRPLLGPLVAALDETRDILAAECRLDQMFFDELARAARGVPRGARAAGCDLVGSEIDTGNLLMVLRNRNTYKLPPETMRGLCLSGGARVPVERCVELCSCPDTGALLAALPEPYRSLLAPLREAELSASENALWNALWRRARRYFGQLGCPAASLAAFPYLKRFEALNLARVFEGTRFGLGPGDLREMMIGPGHV